MKVRLVEDDEFPVVVNSLTRIMNLWLDNGALGVSSSDLKKLECCNYSPVIINAMVILRDELDLRHNNVDNL